MKCPNRNRKKRTGPGGGQPGCQGSLEVVLRVPVIVRLKSWGKRGGVTPTFEEAIPARFRRHGVRITPQQLAWSYSERDADIWCATCGWSLRRVTDGLRMALVRRARGRRK